MSDIDTLEAFKLEALDRSQAIVDSEGRPSFQFQRFWQNFAETIQAAIRVLAESIDAILAAHAAADAATAAAASADAAAAAAQAAADDAGAGSSLATSGVTGLTMTATDAGADATITISAHTRIYGDGNSVAVSGGSVTGLAYSTGYYVYYSDPARAGGAVTYLASINAADASQIGDTHSLGAVTTPAAAAPPNNGNINLPPGVREP